MAVSGGWTDPGTFMAGVIFLETPHRMNLTCGANEGAVAVSWSTVPLRGERLADLRMPR